MKDINEINDFKLRLGYGITGQQDIGYDYYYMPTYYVAQTHAYYPVGYDDNLVEGENGIYYSYRPGEYNTDLTWEKTTTYNAGLDIAVLNNRITFNLDYYYRNTTDLINRVGVPAGSNFKNRVTSNVGSLRNQGVEFAMNAVIFDTKNFKWDFGFNAAWNDNKITSLYGSDTNPDYNIESSGLSAGTDNYITYHHTGNAMSSFFVYQTGSTTDTEGNKVYYVVDRNKDGEINAKDRYYYHDPAPKVVLGIQSKWQFYGFDLGITLRSHIGNYVYNDVLANSLQNVASGAVYKTQSGGYTGLLRECYDLYWREGFRSDNLYKLVYADGVTPSIASDKSNEWYLSDRFVENASFLRIDNITLGYSFNKPKIQARVYATVSNPCVFSKYSGLDPEIYNGVDNNIYPRCMTTVVGVSLHF